MSNTMGNNPENIRSGLSQKQQDELKYFETKIDYSINKDRIDKYEGGLIIPGYFRNKMRPISPIEFPLVSRAFELASQGHNSDPERYIPGYTPTDRAIELAGKLIEWKKRNQSILDKHDDTFKRAMEYRRLLYERIDPERILQIIEDEIKSTDPQGLVTMKKKVDRFRPYESCEQDHVDRNGVQPPEEPYKVTLFCEYQSVYEETKTNFYKTTPRYSNYHSSGVQFPSPESPSTYSQTVETGYWRTARSETKCSIDTRFMSDFSRYFCYPGQYQPEHLRPNGNFFMKTSKGLDYFGKLDLNIPEEILWTPERLRVGIDIFYNRYTNEPGRNSFPNYYSQQEIIDRVTKILANLKNEGELPGQEALLAKAKIDILREKGLLR